MIIVRCLQINRLRCRLWSTSGRRTDRSSTG
jgi:hypothetical protein